ncbi:hypothetical protein PV416_22795 [Streptomyces ipomoeae]|uniref:hypothetical protein n=1 Tax=Streptomyces ipomoeae TaxID=103232 RepID=UPI00215D3191|nr:hypothetical protein [Streptomyces ipomoeae]MDX2823848.1 hypothetical protein [Streptomyces ipomoeae]MDX2876456.1 hypothetical protein [Streptomyces ipomoeae]
MAPAGEVRASGVAVTLVVHEHKRLGRVIDPATLAEELKASAHIRDRTLEGHESARKRGKTIGATGDDMLAMVPHHRDHNPECDPCHLLSQV